MKTILVFLVFVSCLNQNEMNNIFLENLKESYSIKDTLQLSLTNKSKTPLNYFIGLECLIDNEWREIINDINNPISQASIVLKLLPNEKRNGEYLLVNVLNKYSSKYDTFRIKINYGGTISTINKQYYSKSFRILK